jgi:hypothetical protein
MRGPSTKRSHAKMGTRGCWGYVIDGEPKLTYNHWDSYPSGLGVEIVAHVQRHTDDLDALRKQVRALRLVGKDDKPTPGERDQLAGHADLNVSTGSLDEWYVLLRNLQGDPDGTLAAGYMIDSRDFPTDSLFCEWAYVIDLDAEMLEVYRGFQEEPHVGRFAPEGFIPKSEPWQRTTYWPVKMVAAFALREIPPDALEQIDTEAYNEA